LMHLARGADHPTTKPVQNAFYTKIINFFHFFKIFGRPMGMMPLTPTKLISA